MSAYTADSAEGRVLLALRAGAAEAFALHDRITGASGALMNLACQRLIAKDGEGYRLTPAGRAACPFRNPLLAPKTAASAEPEPTQEEIMPKGIKQPYDQDEFLATIRAAGPAGITRKELVRIYSEVVCERVVDRWICKIRAAVPAVVRSPKFGVLAAIDVQRASLAEEVAKIEAEFAGFSAPDDLAESARVHACRHDESPDDELLEFEIEPQAATDESSRGALANQSETSSSPVSPNQQAWTDDIIIVDPDVAEFALFSSGGLDIYYEDSTVSMTAPVLRKLRNFLGLFGGGA